MPSQRYKLSILAGDETGDADFILFGRTAQWLTKKTADTLIADNPVGFIPDEITRLLEKTFIWNVSFTESTIDTGNITFQVNMVVGEIDDGNAVIPATPVGSQTSSLMLSDGAGTSIQNTPQKGHALTLSPLPASSEASLASSATPTKTVTPASKPLETPQSVGNKACDKAKVLASTGDSHAGSSAKTKNSNTKKRSRASPDKKVAKKLFPGEEDGGDDKCGTDDGVGAVDQTSPINDA